MKEFPVLFGPEGKLMGVVSTPATVPSTPVACLLFNMGAYYRIGPRRLNVKLARALAADGISSIRFDLSGLGDSGAPTGTAHFQAQAVQDLQAAMNFLETTLGIRRFLVIGLCSGAVNGMALAVEDPRVVGLLMMDGYVFPSAATQRAHTMHRLLALPTNPALRHRAAGWLRRKLSGAAGRQTAGLFAPEAPDVLQARFRHAMVTLSERHASVMFVYSGSIHVRDRGRDQWGAFAAEPFMQKMEYRFMPEIDHTFITAEGQRLFVAEATAWAVRAAAARPPAAQARAASLTLQPADTAALARQAAGGDLVV